jgi:hypothetical protein
MERTSLNRFRFIRTLVEASELYKDLLRIVCPSNIDRIANKLPKITSSFFFFFFFFSKTDRPSLLHNSWHIEHLAVAGSGKCG